MEVVAGREVLLEEAGAGTGGEPASISNARGRGWFSFEPVVEEVKKSLPPFSRDPSLRSHFLPHLRSITSFSGIGGTGSRSLSHRNLFLDRVEISFSILAIQI
ncbi:hypothetical protein QYF36_025084 [Acer negundo]|nr:hypothetical protein QYF36_014732 [Acer negundo]KAK4839800.1 hypothetical protein QYF36_025084 [Acer negundo]